MTFGEKEDDRRRLFWGWEGQRDRQFKGTTERKQSVPMNGGVGLGVSRRAKQIVRGRGESCRTRLWSGGKRYKTGGGHFLAK